MSGYSVALRHRIVTRWMELEEQQQPQATAFALPKTFAEALAKTVGRALETSKIVS